jgi:hypothetical protein
VKLEGLEVYFGGLTAKGTVTREPGLTITKFEGWRDGVDGDYDEERVIDGPGSVDVPVELSSRIVTMSGRGRATTLGDLAQLSDRVTGQLGGKTARPFRVRELLETTWAPAQCIKAKFPIFGGQLFGDYSMTFWMPKPWKFGETTESFENGEFAIHRGNTESVPYFRIGGSRPLGYTIHGPQGKSVVVTRPVVPGVLHEYNMTDGELYVGGLLVDGGITRGDSWALAGGGGFAHTITGGDGPFQTLLRKVTI